MRSAFVFGEITVDGSLRQAVFRHEIFDQSATCAFVTQFYDLIISKRGTLSELNTSILRLLDPVHLPLGADLGLKLADGPEHVEQKPSGAIGCVDVLIKDDKIDAFIAKGLGNLAEMQRGSS